MVAAAELAGAGLRVALVDEHDAVGGFIASGELTLPGYTHDAFSSWHPLFVSGGGYAELAADLHRHGLEYRNTDGAVTAAVSERGTAIAWRDPAATADALERPEDRDAYRAMLARMDAWGPTVFGALGTETGTRELLGLAGAAWRRLRGDGLRELARAGAQSGRAFTREHFAGGEVDQLWTPWLLHAGLGPDHASGGIMLPVMAASMHGFGLPVVAGGAAHFVRAFEGLLAERGVDLILGQRAERISVSGGRADAVVVGGRTLRARRAVLASTSTRALYEELLPASAVGKPGAAALARYRPGRAAMQIHLALDSPPAWTDRRLADVPLVHVGNGSDSTGIACAQAEAGLLPAAPTLVVGQQCVLDPVRAPQGGATLWIQLQEVPFRPRADAAGEIDTRGEWTPQVVGAYVDRVLQRLEEHAPGIRGRILGSAVYSPPDLTAANRNAVDGDPYGGAVELDQNLLWRPGSGIGHRTEVDGLFHIGAFTHPGPGLGGGSGHIVAQRLLRGSPADRIRERASALRKRR
ncbi:NAD(P)/FAD-dependent oxidoreductase [Tomitella fengzijianii]|uniref:Pyridine nucleotide-disulfide oxidoreductase domain-containing protein 2 n=2 Tax=Tomitella fengzijianii TaxID=2597660 RepID=A0A516X7C6_9ACTN|nr:NAD(P)/FAD-dependent oxidoreductase [Tomitella fengzijianii]